jgi:hypothetical protein
LYPVPISKNITSIEWSSGFIRIYLRRVKDPLCHDLAINCPVKAGPVSGMTGGSGLLHLIQETVLIAVNEDAGDPLEMAAFLTFFPDFLPAAAEIMGITGLPGQLHGILIGIGNHQYIPGIPVNNNDGDQGIDIMQR